MSNGKRQQYKLVATPGNTLRKKRSNQGKDKKKWITKLLIPILSGLLIVFIAAFVVWNKLGENNPYSSVDTNERLDKYLSLTEQNEDMTGWLKIEYTAINFAVMQTLSDEDFYLAKGFDKEDSSAGLVFLDKDCSITDPSLNIVIYAGISEGI